MNGGCGLKSHLKSLLGSFSAISVSTQIFKSLTVLERRELRAGEVDVKNVKYQPAIYIYIYIYIILTCIEYSLRYALCSLLLHTSHRCSHQGTEMPK